MIKKYSFLHGKWREAYFIFAQAERKFEQAKRSGETELGNLLKLVRGLLLSNSPYIRWECLATYEGQPLVYHIIIIQLNITFFILSLFQNDVILLTLMKQLQMRDSSISKHSLMK